MMEMVSKSPEGHWVPINLETVPEKIEFAIRTDLMDRKGFDNIYDELDRETRDEIKERWLKLIREILEYANG